MIDRGNAPRPNGNPTPALVGRARERALLHEHLEQSAAGLGRLVLVRGKAGVGKTALIDDLAVRASERQVRVLTGHCYDLTMIRPYGPWIEAARGYEAQIARSTPPGEPATEVPRQLWAEEQPSAAPSQLALFETVVTFLAGASAQRPLCLLLEDLHWSDQSSIDLLRFAGRQLSSLPLLVVATYRDDELTADFPLYQRLPNLVREALAERITVQPLDEVALAELVAARYGLPEADVARLVAILQGLTEGNALYASELLHSLEEEGVLRQGPGGWQLGDLTRVQVPPLLREVIDARLGRLSREARSALQVAAVIGPQVPLDLWGSVCQIDDAPLLDIADEAIEAHILEEGATIDRLRFRHALIREALVESLHGPRRRVWHQRIAEGHAAARLPEPDRVAHHFQQAHDPRAVDWLIEAGRRAQWSYAWIEAAERYESAARWLEEDGERARERGWLLYWAGMLLRFSDPLHALRDMEEAIRVAGRVPDPLLTLLARFYAGHFQHELGDSRRGIAETTEACRAGDAALRAGAFDGYEPPPLWPIDPSSSIDAHRRAARELIDQPRHPICVPWGTVTIYLAWLGYIADARSIGSQLAALWPPVPRIAPSVAVLHSSSGSAWADLYHGLGIANALAGLPDEARQAFAAALAIYQAIDHRLLVGDAYTHELELVLIPYAADQLGERRRLAEAAATNYSAAGGAITSGVNMPLAAIRSWLALLDGRWSEAEGATATYRASPSTTSWWQPRLGAALCILARQRGDRSAAWGYVGDMLPQGPATEPGGERVVHVMTFQRLAAELAMDGDHLGTAREWIEAHERWLAWSGVVPGRSEGQLLWARYQRLRGDAAGAGRHARAALELASEPRQPLAILAARRALGELETSAGRFDDALRHLDEALTLLALAELQAASGRRDEARVTLEDARAICEPLGAAPALARADALAARLGAPRRAAQPAGLSPREVEVLQLIAAGKGNKEIALALDMGLRTVERHSTNLYAKIGAASRAEAIAFAHQHGLIGT